MSLPTLLTPVLIGTVLDAIAQYLIFGRVRVLPAFLVGALVMGVPYSLLRGITNRWITHRRAGPRQRHPGHRETKRRGATDPGELHSTP